MIAAGSKLGPYEVQSAHAGDFFGLGTTVGITLAAQLGIKLSF